MSTINRSDADTSKSRSLINENKLNFQDMRQQLLETEKKLNIIKRLEEEVQSVTSETSDKISRGSRGRHQPWSQPDDVESTASMTSLNSALSAGSVLSTIPGSYTGLYRAQPVKASTPSQALGPNSHQGRLDGFESDSSTDSTKENRSSSSRHERHLLLQNQRLLLEVERLITDLHHAKLENASLSKDADSSRKVPDLEEQIEELKAENKAQDKALREAEQHLEQGSKKSSELNKKIEGLEQDIEALEQDHQELRQIKIQVEQQRDDAIHNLMEAQDTLEDYQRRSKDRQHKMEESEDSLREALTAIREERDDLLDQLNDMQSTVAAQESQINRLLRDVEQEETDRLDVQSQNEALNRQLSQLTAQISDCESLMAEGELIRKEKTILEQELGQHRALASEMQGLMDLLSTHGKYLNDSGNASTVHDDQQYLSSVALNRNNNGDDEHPEIAAENPVRRSSTEQSVPAKPKPEKEAKKSTVNFNPGAMSRPNMCIPSGPPPLHISCPGPGVFGDLRTIYSNMDGEIQRMRTDLRKREADDRTYQNLSEELRIIMDKAEKGMQRNQELECIITQLEDNKHSLEAKLTDAIRALEDRDRQNQCLDTRLSERNRQVVCLQEDCNNKATKMSQMDCMIRDLKKQLSQCGSEDLSGAIDALRKKLRECEEYSAVKEASLADLQKQFIAESKEWKLEKAKQYKKNTCLTDQIHDFERSLKQMSEENEGLRAKIQTLNKSSDELKRTIRTKDDMIKNLENKINEDLTTWSEKEGVMNKMIEGLQQKGKQSCETNKQLESALAMCRQEVQKHLQTLDDIRKHFESEVCHKDGALKQMNEMLRKVREDYNCKVDEQRALEQSVSQMKTKMDNLYKSMSEEQKKNMCLVDRLKLAEKQSLGDKAQHLKDMEELDRRLGQSINQVNCSQTENNKLKQALQEKSAMVDCLSIEKNSCIRDLQAIKQKACEMQEQMTKMEGDNSQLCTQLQHKMDCIKDLEKVLCQKDHDLKNCTRCLDDLNKKFNSANNNKGDYQQEMRGLVDKLKNATDDLLKKNRLLVECEESLKRSQMDVCGKQDEIDTLNMQLKDLNCKLQERIVKVEELEKAIESIHKETEKRMKRVDDQLRRYECELSEKCRQLTNMDECLATCQQNLTQKANELCQLEQKCQHLYQDLHTMDCKLKDMDEQRVSCSKQLNESKAENAEVTQELRVTREELQSQHCELVETRQSLVNCNREVEKHRRQCDDLKANIEKKECELKKCHEDKNSLLSKVAHLQCRLEQESSQATKHFNDLKGHMEKELQNCRGCTMELEQNNAHLVQQLNQCKRQLQQVEKCAHQKLDTLNRELEDLLNRLADREDQISALKDTVNLKEADMMRLKLRLCSCDMANTSHNNNNNSSLIDSSYLNTNTNNNNNNHNHNNSNSNNHNNHNRSVDSFTADHQGAASLVPGPQSVVNSDRESLGVSEVQERLRSNQRLQMQIEAQLQSLEGHVEGSSEVTDPTFTPDL